MQYSLSRSSVPAVTRIAMETLSTEGVSYLEATMSDNPLCPNCSRPMHITRTLPHADCDVDDVNVFKCSYCGVNFITEDHVPVAGERVQ
jgi:hypothetical protein